MLDGGSVGLAVIVLECMVLFAVIGGAGPLSLLCAKHYKHRAILHYSFPDPHFFSLWKCSGQPCLQTSPVLADQVVAS